MPPYRQQSNNTTICPAKINTMNKLLIFLALLFTTPLFSQQRVRPNPADVESVDAIITALYDVISGPAGQERNWDRLRSLFTREARLMNVYLNQDGLTGMLTMTLEDYSLRAEKPFIEKGFFERELNRETDHFGFMCKVGESQENREKARRDATSQTTLARGLASSSLHMNLVLRHSLPIMTVYTEPQLDDLAERMERVELGD